MAGSRIHKAARPRGTDSCAAGMGLVSMTGMGHSALGSLARIGIATAGAMLIAWPAVSAEVYKWVDEHGVTTYSNEPPPRGRKATKVEADDRMSTYTPDPAVTQALEAERNRRASPPPPAPIVVAPLPPPPGSAPPPPAPPVQAAPVTSGVRTAPFDPCLTGSDPNCFATGIYDASPVFIGRQRAPVLNQPQIAPGTIAGQSTGSAGVTPGLSGMTPQPLPQPPPRGSTRSAPRRDGAREELR